MDKHSDATSTTAESTVEDTAVTAEESFEPFEEPTGAQLAEAQREMERALRDMKNKSSGDSTLSRYFREMANHPVLTPTQEVEAAKEVERLEIGYWASSVRLCSRLRDHRGGAREGDGRRPGAKCRPRLPPCASWRARPTSRASC